MPHAHIGMRVCGMVYAISIPRAMLCRGMAWDML